MDNKIITRRFLRAMALFSSFTCFSIFIISGRLYYLVNKIKITWYISYKQFLLVIIWVSLAIIDIIDVHDNKEKIIKNTIEIIILTLICVISTILISTFKEDFIIIQ